MEQKAKPEQKQRRIAATVLLVICVDIVWHTGKQVGAAGKQGTSKWCAGAMIAVYEIAQEATKEIYIEMVNINSVSFYNK